MKKYVTYACAALLLSAQSAAAQEMSADLLGNDGKTIGTVKFNEGPHGVVIHVQAKGLTPGAHGMHFHSVGDCSDHQHFKAAAGHITSSETLQHGLLNADGFHEGDLPNLYADKDGVAEAEFFTTHVTLSGASKPALLDNDGSAVMIHALPDDHVSQPIGGAGDRVACAVVKLKK